MINCRWQGRISWQVMTTTRAGTDQRCKPGVCEGPHWLKGDTLLFIISASCCMSALSGCVCSCLCCQKIIDSFCMSVRFAFGFPSSPRPPIAPAAPIMHPTVPISTPARYCEPAQRCRCQPPSCGPCKVVQGTSASCGYCCKVVPGTSASAGFRRRSIGKV